MRPFYWQLLADKLIEVPPGMLLGSFQQVRKKNRTSLVNHWPGKDGKRATGQKPCIWEILDVASQFHPLTRVLNIQCTVAGVV